MDDAHRPMRATSIHGRQTGTGSGNAGKLAVGGALVLGLLFIDRFARSSGAVAAAAADTDQSGGGADQVDVGGGAFGGVEWVNPTPEEFVASVQRFIDDDPEMGAFLTAHDPDELREHTLIGTENGRVGVAVSPEGDVQNLFNHSGPSGAGEEALKRAIDAGGRTLDCYDGYLKVLYARYGFRETGRMRFDPEFAPDGWDFDRFGQPDVVFMAYKPSQTTTAGIDRYYEPSYWAKAKDDSRRAAER